MRAWRAVVAAILAVSLTGAGGALCQSQPEKPMSCCGSARHEGRRKAPATTCADRCASPEIATQGAAVPVRSDRFVAMAPSAVPMPVVASRRNPLGVVAPANYESPPPVRISDRAPPAR